MFSLRQEFPTQWHRFLNPVKSDDGNVFVLEMVPKLFHRLDDGKTLKVNLIWLLARCSEAGSYGVMFSPPLEPPRAGEYTMQLASVDRFGGLHVGEMSTVDQEIKIAPADPPITWLLRMTRPDGEDLRRNDVTDIVLVLGYTWE
jgi:hypothetical protein